ncbi:MAG: Tryptophanyl-tRNA synthetase [uncultured Thermomicrobiales bacterium]|uniref:Tryptophan--tRNA ligase n=1 Tax=uncultured Thermomicrobiales bacterium TaxID=1645740 RepID=A0A6J4ULD3_9BACT|nr:MAG: Tryptophanyl-tRNA synthetase [uncultured Thermomicrobiales bacterium]
MVVQERELVEPQALPTDTERRQRTFSGIQPSGSLHLGNYLGAIRNWVNQQEHDDSIFCVVDLHALSLPITPQALRENILDLANVLLASGIDPERSVLFVQSDVREHAELCWLLTSVTQFGELRRMTQFKDKSGGQDEAVAAALFIYPVLQAGDIILYDADKVPVGEDQKQHIELTRDIAARFNARYGETFVLPRPDIKPTGARIMALDDPARKMSKSAANPGSFIALTDDADTIRRKIKRAVTDSGGDVRAGTDKPALTNLLAIYALCAGEPIEQIEARYAGRGYGAFKADLAEVVVGAVEPIQRRLAELSADPSVARGVLARGAELARERAATKMAVVRERMGIGGAG